VVAAGSTLVLARLLDREAFGVAAYAITFTTLLEVLRGLGIGQALIFFPRDEKRTETAFWLMIANGVVLGLIALLAAPLLGLFFRDERAPAVIRTLALYFPLLSLGQVLDVELRKDLHFGRRFGPELTRAVVKAVVAVALAMLGAGYWSLVAAHIVGAAAWSIALFMIVDWRPRWSFDRTEAKKLLDYGKHMVAAAVLVAIGLRADSLAVGRFQGAAALGVYTIAFTLPAFVFQASAGLSQVLFPAYARLDRDRERLRSASLRTLRLAAAVFLPAGAGLGLVAAPLVVVAFGASWSDAAAILPWMGAWAGLSAATQHLGEVYKALGKARVYAWVLAISTVATILGLIAVGRFGWDLVAVVLVLIATRVIRVSLDLMILRRLVDLRFSAVVSAALPATISMLLMSAAVLAARGLVPAWPAWVQLVVLAALGASVYAGSLALLDRGLIAEVRELLRSAIAGRGRGSREAALADIDAPLS
jgi:PST family polysaccharide transporter